MISPEQLADRIDKGSRLFKAVHKKGFGMPSFDIKVKWDESLSPQPPDGPLAKWDRWFALVGLSKNWENVKAICGDDKAAEEWAKLMELNRLDGSLVAQAEGNKAI